MSGNLKTLLLAGAAIITLGATTGVMAADVNTSAKTSTESSYQYPNEFPSDERTAGMNENEANYRVEETAEQKNALDLDVKAQANSPINASITDDKIEDAQTALKAEGYRVTVDGIVGPETRSAIRSFQEANDIDVSGNLTPQTLNALQLSMNTATDTHK